MSSRATIDRPAIGHLIRRYRRPLAAVSAGLAVVLALAVITSASPGPVRTDLEIAAGPGPGEVAAPITLASGEIASSLSVGDIIDIIAIPTIDTLSTLPADQGGGAAILARKARVLQVSDSSGFTSNNSALIVIAVSESVALTLAGASSTSVFTALIH